MYEPSLRESESNADYNLNFLSGIYHLTTSQYSYARNFFFQAVSEEYPLQEHYSVYQSYLGLSDVLMDYQDGILEHCYHSTDNSLPSDPEVQLNLALAEFMKGNRRRAFQAMEKINSADLPRDVYYDVLELFKLVGCRQSDKHGILKRENFLNKSMGKLFRTKKPYQAVDIEQFIKNISIRRYKDAMQKQLH